MGPLQNSLNGQDISPVYILHIVNSIHRGREVNSLCPCELHPAVEGLHRHWPFPVCLCSMTRACCRRKLSHALRGRDLGHGLLQTVKCILGAASWHSEFLGVPLILSAHASLLPHIPFHVGPSPGHSSTEHHRSLKTPAGSRGQKAKNISRGSWVWGPVSESETLCSS